jgi:hypothetical protein
MKELLGEIIDSGYFDIAYRIHAIWGTPECPVYLNKLLLQDRIDRQGFPERVIVALMELQQLIPEETVDIWGPPRSRLLK